MYAGSSGLVGLVRCASSLLYIDSLLFVPFREVLPGPNATGGFVTIWIGLERHGGHDRHDYNLGAALVREITTRCYCQENRTTFPHPLMLYLHTL